MCTARDSHHLKHAKLSCDSAAEVLLGAHGCDCGPWAREVPGRLPRRRPTGQPPPRVWFRHRLRGRRERRRPRQRTHSAAVGDKRRTPKVGRKHCTHRCGPLTAFSNTRLGFLFHLLSAARVGSRRPCLVIVCHSPHVCHWLSWRHNDACYQTHSRQVTRDRQRNAGRRL